MRIPVLRNGSTLCLKGGILFSIASTIPAISVVGFRFDTDSLYIFILIPMVCAMIAGLLLGGKIKYIHNKSDRNITKSLLFSILIVISSLLLWVLPTAILFGNFEIKNTATTALMAGTLLGLFTYPPGLSAGLVLWFFSKRSHQREQSNG